MAANNLFRRNLLLIQQQLATTRYQVDAMMDTTATYKYTTFAETKALMARHRPKILTMAEALDVVDRRGRGEWVDVA